MFHSGLGEEYTEDWCNPAAVNFVIEPAMQRNCGFTVLQELLVARNGYCNAFLAHAYYPLRESRYSHGLTHTGSPLLPILVMQARPNGANFRIEGSKFGDMGLPSDVTTSKM